MDELNFNLYAFVRPQTTEEYASLLEEGLRLARQLNEQLEEIERHRRNA